LYSIYLGLKENSKGKACLHVDESAKIYAIVNETFAAIKTNRSACGIGANLFVIYEYRRKEVERSGLSIGLNSLVKDFI